MGPRTTWSWAVAGILLLSASGCAEKMGPVSGIVTLNGQPLDGATIGFHPLEAGSGKGAPRQANGLTNKEGRFSLETVNDKGAMAGEYKVTVSKKVYPPGVKPPESNNMIEMMQMSSKQVEYVPKEYTSMNTTTLKITIPRGGMTDANLELKGEPGIALESDAAGKK